MSKNKVFPLKDEKYTKILVEIGRETPSIKELATRISMSDSSTTESLDELEKINCIERKPSKKPYKHKKDVSINWQGLTKQYLIYLVQEQKIKELIGCFDIYSINPFIQNLIKLVIRDHQKKFHNTRNIVTIYHLFEKITMQIVYSDVNYSNRIFKRLRKKDIRFRLYRKFIKDIKHRKTADERETYAKFLRQIVNDINNERTSKKNN